MWNGERRYLGAHDHKHVLHTAVIRLELGFSVFSYKRTLLRVTQLIRRNNIAEGDVAAGLQHGDWG